MPFFDDFLNFTNSFTSDDPWSLDPYANGDEENNIFSPNFRRNACSKKYDDEDDEDDEQQF